MRWLLLVVAFAGSASAHNETPKPQPGSASSETPKSPPPKPCTCIAKQPVEYMLVAKRKPTLFESQTITNLDSAHNSHFARCLRENNAASFELELKFTANQVEPKVRAFGSDKLVKCVEDSKWTFFGPPDKNTTVRYAIGNSFALEKQRLEAAKQAAKQRRARRR